MTDLFEPVAPEEFVSLNEDAVPMLVNEYMRQDEEGRFRMFKLFGTTAKYSWPESFLIAQCMLELMRGGAPAFDAFVQREFEQTTAQIIEAELRGLFPDEA
jgi:hypothetical protein